jgi:hypothetical protein
MTGGAKVPFESVTSQERRALAWLDSWAEIGHVAVGMHRQGYDLQLTRYDERDWRATFYTGMEHSPTSATGTGWERTPWRVESGASRGVRGAPSRPRKEQAHDRS